MQLSVVLEPRQIEFLRWLLDPRSTAKPERDDPQQFKGSQADWARRKKLSPTTLSKWKADPKFRSGWDEAIQQVNGGPERLQEILQSLADIALGKDKSARAADRIAASRLHLEVVGRHQPKTIVEVRDPRLDMASDKDLLDKAEVHARRIADARRAVGLHGQATVTPIRRQRRA
jgi:hypothetical protein